MDLVRSVVEPVEPAIDKVEELIGHSPHPAIVALPLGSWVASNVCDVLGMMTGSRRYDDAARLTMGIGLVGAVPSALTGLRDYSSIPEHRESHPVATRHAWGNAAVGSLFAASFVLRSLDHAAGRRPGLAARLLALTGGALGLYTAWLGGVLVQNYGEGVQPVMERQKGSEGRGRRRLSPDAPLGPHDDAPARPGPSTGA